MICPPGTLTKCQALADQGDIAGQYLLLFPVSMPVIDHQFVNIDTRHSDLARKFTVPTYRQNSSFEHQAAPTIKNSAMNPDHFQVIAGINDPVVIDLVTIWGKNGGNENPIMADGSGNNRNIMTYVKAKCRNIDWIMPGSIDINNGFGAACTP